MFTNPLVIKEIGYDKWEVVEDFEFHSDTGLVVSVHRGFKTDLASIPELFAVLVSKIGYWSQPAVTHDLLYARHRDELDSTITRKQADRILREGCRIKAHEYGVPDLKRRDHLIYQAVRFGGTASWETLEEKLKREHSKEDDWFLDQ